MTAPCVDGTVQLTPRAEQQFQLAAERCGGLEIERDEAVQATNALNFLDDCVVLLVAATA